MDEIKSQSVETSLWEKAIKRTIFGILFTVFTISQMNLEYILPLIGFPLAVVGLRTLRKENKYFKYVTYLMLIRTLLFTFNLALDASIYRSTDFVLHYIRFVNYLNMGLILFIFIFMTLAMIDVKTKAGLKGESKWSYLVLWHLAILIVVLTGVKSFFIVLALIVMFVVIAFSIIKEAMEVDSLDYKIKDVKVKFSRRYLALILVLIMLLPALIVHYSFYSYPMSWEKVVGNNVQDDIRDELLAKGVDADVLADISDEELSKMSGFKEVITSRNDFYLDNYRSFKDEKAKILVKTIFLRMDDKGDKWKVIEYFWWNELPDFYGTECIRTIPVSYTIENFSGEVLCDMDGFTHRAKYYSLFGDEKNLSDSFFDTQDFRQEFYANFSFPKNSYEQRCYFVYDIDNKKEDLKLYSSVFYYHQKARTSFPASTALDIASGKGIGYIEGSFDSGLLNMKFVKLKDDNYSLSSH